MQQQIITPADAVRMEATGMVPDHLVDSTLPTILKAEIDSQIATAKAFPRSIHKAIENICTLATLDEETAAECLYALVRKKKQRGRGGQTEETENKPIEGPSIRLAEIAAQCWGNNRIKSRVITVNKKDGWVEALGVFHDLETNMASEATIRRNILTSGGHVFSNDMITVTGNAAAAIAKRNAILAGIPRGIYRRAYQDARAIVAGNQATLGQNREKAIAAFASFGVTADQIFESLDVEGEGDIKLDHIVTLRGMFMALKNGEATVEEMFAKEKPSQADPDYNPLVKKDTAAGAGDAASGDQEQSAGDKPATESAAAEAAHPSDHAAGHQPAVGSDSAATSAQTSAKPAPADEGTSQERTASGSSQPDLLSGPTSAQDGKPQSSVPQGSTADGADASRGRVASAPDQLRSYHRTLSTIENGGPPKLGKMSLVWYEKNGKDEAFDDANHEKAKQILVAHTERLTGSIDLAACAKKVEEIIAR
ncbi:hypothetical protein ACVILK_000658 [Bradyrhizobium embrapense]